MKIDSYIWFDGDYYRYYEDCKTGYRIFHGLCNAFYSSNEFGYYYHGEMKGFWLKGKYRL